MTIDTINRTLQERFAAELPDCYQRRIIFWFDSDREFEKMLDELEIPGVKLLKLTGDNFFAAKMLLSETDTQNNYLVYDPLTYSHREDNWLSFTARNFVPIWFPCRWKNCIFHRQHHCGEQ